jgi:hypothetical protein
MNGGPATAISTAKSAFRESTRIGDRFYTDAASGHALATRLSSHKSEIGIVLAWLDGSH